jgi:hypothetical protein
MLQTKCEATPWRVCVVLAHTHCIALDSNLSPQKHEAEDKNWAHREEGKAGQYQRLAVTSKECGMRAPQQDEQCEAFARQGLMVIEEYWQVGASQA